MYSLAGVHNLIYKVAIFCNIQKIVEYYDEKDRVINYQPPNDVAIELENINMVAEDKVIIEDFDYKFKKNRTYGILGPSGAGKSVLVDHFNGLTKSKKGNIYLFNGEKIVFFKKKIKNYREIRRNVGMVLQFPEYQLFQETVLGDVCYGLKMLGISSEEAIEKAKTKLNDLEIGSDFFNSNPLLLSGGQKRKVALAGILAIDPEIIIFDEPSIGLDPQSEEKVSEIIKQLKKEQKTLIIISHNMDLILDVADEILVLDKGKFIQSGDPYYIFKKYQWKIGLPKIISFIQKLCEKNPKFAFLWKVKPTNINDLSAAISNAVNNQSSFSETQENVGSVKKDFWGSMSDISRSRTNLSNPTTDAQKDISNSNSNISDSTSDTSDVTKDISDSTSDDESTKSNIKINDSTNSENQ